MPILANAAAAVGSSDIQSILTTIQGQISVATIVEILGVAVSAAVGFVFMWWGIRKLIQVIMSAVRKGKLGA